MKSTKKYFAILSILLFVGAILSALPGYRKQRILAQRFEDINLLTSFYISNQARISNTGDLYDLVVRQKLPLNSPIAAVKNRPCYQLISGTDETTPEAILIIETNTSDTNTFVASFADGAVRLLSRTELSKIAP